jgi:precorrin-2 dehydrogenase/sirohydrochlorin ferrochelatase
MVIVNLNLQERVIIIVGGGEQALKRTNSLLKEKCKIILISETINKPIRNLVKDKKIQFRKLKIENLSILSEYNPYMIITTTNDEKLNQRIINYAKTKKIIAYSADNPESSDFANPSIINFENLIQIAIFTGGKSPAISKRLKIKSEEIFRKIITNEDIAQIKIQDSVRDLAKTMILTQKERKMYLDSVMSNKEIKQLIKDGQLKKAEKKAINILKDWK